MSTIDGVNFDGSINIVHSGVCATAAATAAKTANVASTNSNFVLEDGAEVTIRFTNGNSATNSTLSINGSIARAIHLNGTALTTAAIAGMIKANSTYRFRYNNATTSWDIVGFALNRTIGGDDSATGTVTDNGGDISVPIPVTVVAPAASATQITAGTRSLRASLKILIDNIAQLFSGKQDKLTTGTATQMRLGNNDLTPSTASFTLKDYSALALLSDYAGLNGGVGMISKLANADVYETLNASVFHQARGVKRIFVNSLSEYDKLSGWTLPTYGSSYTITGIEIQVENVTPTTSVPQRCLVTLCIVQGSTREPEKFRCGGSRTAASANFTQGGWYTELKLSRNAQTSTGESEGFLSTDGFSNTEIRNIGEWTAVTGITWSNTANASYSFRVNKNTKQAMLSIANTMASGHTAGGTIATMPTSYFPKAISYAAASYGSGTSLSATRLTMLTTGVLSCATAIPGSNIITGQLTWNY
ncbi:MAG: hypothetical protein FWC26_01295 [Fibromonadales bacterium]|nr:hypothetical protein [Fibromonadales bacterium]